MEFYALKSTELPRFVYRNLQDALAKTSEAPDREKLISDFCAHISELQPSGDWLRMKWCVPATLKSMLTQAEYEKIDASLAQKRKRRNDRLLEAYPHCSDEYSTSQEFLDAAIGSQCYSIITPQTRIFTIGSCFARNIANHLKNKGFDVYSYPQVEDLNSPFSNAKMLSVCVADEHERRAYVEHWLGLLYPDNKNLKDIADKALARLGELAASIKSSDFIIITCGNVLDYFLTSSDIRQDGVAVAPKFLSVSYKDDIDVRSNLTRRLKDLGSKFRLGTYDEVSAALSKLYEAVRSINPDAHILFTLSPVPIDTALGIDQERKHSAIEIDCVSKSLLRAALHDFMTQHAEDKKLLYFQSFEIVRWIAPCMGEAVFGKEDAGSTHVSQHVLSGIYDYFVHKFSSSMPVVQTGIFDVENEKPAKRKKWKFFGF